MVSTDYLNKYPATVENLLRGQLTTLAAIKANPEQSRDQVNSALQALTGKALKPEVLARAWPNLTITVDPIAASMKADQEHAEAVKLAQPVSLDGIYDLRLLNGLSSSGQQPVGAAGLGQQ